MSAHAFARSIKGVIQEGIELQSKYGAALKKEQEAVMKGNADKAEEFAYERNEIINQIQSALERQKEIVEKISGDSKTPLRAAIEKFAPKEEKRALLKLAEIFRTTINKTQNETKDFGLIATFAHNMASSLVSIFWSATQGVAKSYGRDKTVQESLHPKQSRTQSVIKKA